MGWGDTNVATGNQEFTDSLMVVDLQVISNTLCEMAEGVKEDGGGTVDYNGWIFEDMLCTSSEGKDACQGDSGEMLSCCICMVLSLFIPFHNSSLNLVSFTNNIT